MNSLLSSSAQNPFDSFQSALHDLERQCTVTSMKKKQADSNLNHLKQNLHRAQEDITDLHRKIREGHSKCCSQLQTFNNCLFDMSNILTRGEYIANQHSECTTDADQLAEFIQQKENHPFLSQLVNCVHDGINGILSRKKENLEMEQTFGKLQHDIKQFAARALSDHEMLRMRQKEKSSLHEASKELRDELHKLSTQLKQLESSDALTSKKLGEVKKEYQSEQQTLQSVEQLLQQRHVECDNLSQHTKQIVKEICAHIGSWGQSQSQLHNKLLQSLKSARKKQSNLERQIESEKNRIQQITKEKNALQKELNEVLRNCTQLSTRKRNLVKNTENLKHMLLETETQVSTHLEEDSRFQENIERLRQETEQLLVRVEELRSRENQKRREMETKEKEQTELEGSKVALLDQLEQAIKEETNLSTSAETLASRISQLEEDVEKTRKSLAANDTIQKIELEKIAEEERYQLEQIVNMKLSDEMLKQLSEKESQLKVAADQEIENLRKEHAALFEETEEYLNDQFQHYELEALQEEENLRKKIDLMKQQMKRKRKKGMKRKTTSSQQSSLSMPKEKRARTVSKDSAEDSNNDFSVFDF